MPPPEPPPKTNISAENKQESASEANPIFESATKWLDAALQEVESAGTGIANSVKDSEHSHPEEQSMLQNFGIVIADSAQSLREIVHPPKLIAPLPNYPGEGYNPFPQIREQLSHANIDPDNLNGVKIMVFDSFNDQSDHGQQVSSVINDSKYGLIHNAKIIPFNNPETEHFPKAAEFIDKPEGINQLIGEMGATYLTSMVTDLQTAIKDQNEPGKGNPSLRVINLSLSMSNSYMYRQLFGILEKEPNNCRPWLNSLIGEKKAQQWVDNLKNKTEPSAESDKLNEHLLQAIQKLVDKELATNEKFQTAHRKYRQATETLAANGISLVVAVGNGQTELSSFGITLEPGAAYNWYAQSDHVIGVGSCNINKTPSNPADDKLTHFSSQGNQRYYPTVLAQGEQLYSRWEGLGGTSFAAPQVSGTVALMLAQNPKLSTSEIKTMLRQNSALLRGEYAQAQGAGILRIADAVIAAKKSRQR